VAALVGDLGGVATTIWRGEMLMIEERKGNFKESKRRR